MPVQKVLLQLDKEWLKIGVIQFRQVRSDVGAQVFNRHSCPLERKRLQIASRSAEMLRAEDFPKFILKWDKVPYACRAFRRFGRGVSGSVRKKIRLSANAATLWSPDDL